MPGLPVHHQLPELTQTHIHQVGDVIQPSHPLSSPQCVKAVYHHPAYLPYIQNTMRNAGLDEAQAGIKIARRNISNLGYTDDTTLMAESEEELKSLLMKVK